MQILLVEDSDDVSFITQEFLAELGHGVAAVKSAELAIAALRDRTYDAVLTDVRLPGISGLELAKALVVQYPTMPIVISSGYGLQTVETIMGAKFKSVFILPKPYDMAALQATLTAAATFAAAKSPATS